MDNLIYDIQGILNSFGISDFLDIIVVAYLMYQAIRLVRETRAIQLVKGLGVLVGVYAIATFAQMRSLSFLIRYVFQYGALALLIVFQPELRRSLEQVGRTRFSSLQLFGGNVGLDDVNSRWRRAISAIGEAATFLSKRRIGALIVLERQSLLGEIIKTGTVIDAIPSAELLGNIFFPNSPLHDGALIIREGRLVAAGCYLPLSDNFTISKEMGTRHRAGLGMSESSDALVVIVSEETGVITVAKNGKLMRGFTGEQLVKELEGAFIIEKREEKGDRMPPFFKVKR
ncbi:diadenylate cyclase CdaA [Oscillospiraceae bacterium LTW-04]|nr:diadenylate cyclase CdaA [Oscillospiraceae bacterium MB24-C1]